MDLEKAWPIGLSRDKPIPKALENAALMHKSWLNERLAAIPAPPDRLYHYTNAAALLNIFKSNELWATNAAYTNDRTEILHSLRRLKGIAEEGKKERRGDPATDTMLAVADNFYSIIEAYLVCFCAAEDLLSQWRAYGQQGGYALGFESSGLRHLLQGGQVMLIPVVYDDAEQDRLIRELVSRWRGAFTDLLPEEDIRQVRKLGAWAFAQSFSLLAVAFKNRTFAEEQEWRLLYRRQQIIPDGSGLTVSFRDRYGMITPYVVFGAAPPKKDSVAVLPVRDIVMGPTTDPRLAGFGIERFLHALGYPAGSVTVRPSAVPLRAYS